MAVAELNSKREFTSFLIMERRFKNTEVLRIVLLLRGKKGFEFMSRVGGVLLQINICIS